MVFNCSSVNAIIRISQSPGHTYITKNCSGVLAFLHKNTRKCSSCHWYWAVFCCHFVTRTYFLVYTRALVYTREAEILSSLYSLYYSHALWLVKNSTVHVGNDSVAIFSIPRVSIRVLHWVPGSLPVVGLVPPGTQGGPGKQVLPEGRRHGLLEEGNSGPKYVRYENRLNALT